ncbi:MULTISPECIES: hypothetical protein [unclassified Pseudoalteromonas]|uniref:hypothetical protein n=1 Tax=unclassified Pseudoalteromonas TaxID=194690 RepID=UPI0025B421B8|nr:MULTISPECIES: hypothetical protein [unclassified Pseudoalteromonas]MDN3380416.1 hypothetical protein [Pseudoalteromonas sp. APC 3893]MDN3388801.1 hypothetical protein [Pseudoalteromonas sp. APC 4017]
MPDLSIIKILKVFIISGLCLILLGHYLLMSDLFDAINSVQRITISATCIAIGILFSLPTKIYLTIYLMHLEAKHKKLKKIELTVKDN